MLGRYVTFDVDAADPQFREFMVRYPGEFTGIPMVYVIDPDGSIRHARSGFLDARELRDLLRSTLADVGPGFSDEQLWRTQGLLEQVREKSTAREFAAALEIVTPLASLPHGSSLVATAKSYERQLLDATHRWVDRLDQQIARQQNPHQAAYHLADLYVSLPKQAKSLREHSLDRLTHHEAQPLTRVPVLQGKRLVRARIEEDRKLCEDAIASYQAVVELDPDSPAGRYAKARLPVVRRRNAEKLIGAPL